MKQLKEILAIVLVFTILTSCIKEAVTESACSCEKQATTEAKQLLMATTWQIDEIIDPFENVRYKRGVKDDTKHFALARYQYQQDNRLTGTDWFGQSLENHCFTLLDNDKKIKFITPACSAINDIISISATQFTYKETSGSIITLTPISSSGNPSREL